jgi:hypothetical protein
VLFPLVTGLVAVDDVEEGASGALAGNTSSGRRGTWDACRFVAAPLMACRRQLAIRTQSSQFVPVLILGGIASIRNLNITIDIYHPEVSS